MPPKRSPELLLAEQTAPATPAAGFVAGPYAKADHKLYAKDSTGAEVALGGGGTTIVQQTSAPGTPAVGDLWIDTDDVPAASQLSFPGLIVPQGSLDNWKTARAAASSRRVNVVGWGASIMQGYYSSSLLTKNYFALLISALQAAYGDGGSGFHSVANLTGIGATGATYGSVTGAWTNSAICVNEATLSNTVSANGASMNFGTGTVRGSNIDVVILGSPTSGIGLLTVDAVSKGDPGFVATPQDIYKRTFAVGGTTHTVVINNVTGFTFVCGVTGYNATGIVGHKMALAGRSSVSGQVTTNLPAGKSSGSVSISDFSPDLVIIGDLGINDVAITTSVDSFIANLYWLIRCARAYSNGTADIVVIVPHIGNGTDASSLFGRYAGALTALAQSAGVVLYSPWALGRTSWGYWNNLGYWGVTSGSTGAAGTDAVHLSDAGMAAQAQPLINLLTA